MIKKKFTLSHIIEQKISREIVADLPTSNEFSSEYIQSFVSETAALIRKSVSAILFVFVVPVIATVNSGQISNWIGVNEQLLFETIYGLTLAGSMTAIYYIGANIHSTKRKCYEILSD